MKILLGVTGGIAAYKALELTRLFKKAGAEVKVVMTDAAQAFVTPLSFQALSGQPVASELLSHDSEAAMGHIELARWADRVIIAPASANCIARLAHGFADDLLTTLCLATTAPILLAPAMNQHMWKNKATEDNLALLVKRGYQILPPDSGEQACGEIGVGRLPEPPVIFDAVMKCHSALSGKTVLITAGPTRELLDPIRYLGNRSSGKMGMALAKAAQNQGARVILILGPVSLTPLLGVTVVPVISAQEMQDAVLQYLDQADLLISAAAVADYQPVEIHTQKIKKSDDTLTMTLKKTPDILKAVTARPHQALIVGFAAETENLLENAERKLKDKKLDAVIANPVGFQHGMETDDQSAVLLLKDGQSKTFELQSKTQLAAALLEALAKHLK